MSVVTQKPRIVIYGVGQYGAFFTRFAVQKGWPVVAAFNRAGSKVGQDLGRVAGLERDLGVIIQDADTADFSGLEADVGLVATTNVLRLNMPAYKGLMAAGLNVLCHGAQAYYPYGNDPIAAAEIDAFAKQHNVTFTGSGIWDMSRIWSGILALGPSTELTSIHHRSITYALAQMNQPQQVKQIGIGMNEEEYAASGLRGSPLANMYRTIPEHVLTASGFTIASTKQHVEPIFFDEPIDTDLIGTVAAGLCVGSRIVVEIATHEGVTAHAAIELRLFKPGEVEYMLWETDGLPRTRVRVERDDSAHATASNLFNRIPDVIAAPPGIVLVSQLGPLKPSILG